MRAIPVLLLLVWATPAAEFGKTLRALKGEDRTRRREALERVAEGAVGPSSRSERERLERVLLRFLSTRFPGAERSLAVRGLGRLESVEALEKLLSWLDEDRDDRVLAAAERTLRRAPPALERSILRHLEAADEPLAQAVFLRLLGALRADGARARLRLRAGVPGHWCPRAAAGLALAGDRDPSTAAALIGMLDDEDPGVLTAAAESLTALTGLRHGRDPAAWKGWWSTRDAADPLPAPAADDRGGRRRYAHEARGDGLTPYWFGIPVRGSRVLFVCDVSASMRYKLPLAYDQLARAVKGLASNCLFEVIFFNEQVWPWRGRLSHADPVTKELLVRHLETIEIKSYTNLFDAIETALELEADEVFVISDGEPNRGRKQHPREILSELHRINTRRAKIHAVSVVRVVDGDRHVDLLRRVAEEHGGTYVERTLK